jgi:hypothetical protein
MEVLAFPSSTSRHTPPLRVRIEYVRKGRGRFLIRAFRGQNVGHVLVDTSQVNVAN